MKIQLDQKALAALIENSPEKFRIDLRNGILATAIRKTIKMPLPDEFKKMCEKEMNKIAQEFFTVKSNYYSDPTFTLKPEIKKEFEKFVEKHLTQETLESFVKPAEDQIHATFKKARKSLYTHIDERIEQMKLDIDHYLTKAINHNIAEHITQAVNARIDVVMIPEAKEDEINAGE